MSVLPHATYREYADEVKLRALKQENEELRRWLSRGTSSVEDSRREREQLSRELESAKEHIRVLQSRRDVAVQERKQAVDEASEAKQKLHMLEQQLVAFTHQIRRVGVQCHQVAAAIHDKGASPEALMRIDSALATPQAPPPRGFTRPTIEVGRDALLQLHRTMGDLLVSVRQRVAVAALGQQADVPVGSASEGNVSPRFAWETAAMRPSVPPIVPHLDAATAAEYANRESDALRERILFIEGDRRPAASQNPFPTAALADKHTSPQRGAGQV